MTTPKFYRKDGLLTAYALACGYVETYDRGALSSRLYKSIGIYIVTTRDLINWKLKEEIFSSLSEARKAYAKQCKLQAVTENYYSVNGERKDFGNGSV